MRRQKLSSHRQKGLNEQDSLDMPVEGQKGIEMTSSSEISKDSIIQKLQMGDYKGARELMKKLGNFEGNKEEKGIIDAIMAEVHDYLSELPEGRRDDILNSVKLLILLLLSYKSISNSLLIGRSSMLIFED